MQDFNELEGIETHIPLMDSYGNIEMIDRAKAPLAIQKHGYTLPSEEQLHKLVLEKKFGDNFGSELRAFAEGAARTATLGGSDLLQTKVLGVPGDEIEARRELNPNASFAGDIAGIAAPLPTGKLGALGKTLEYLMPLKAAEKLGAKVTEAAAPRVGKLVGSLVNAEKRPIANEILTQAGAHGLGSVIPGMAFGAGETVTEYALGDPGLNAEKALANIGYSGAFAGAFGAAFGGVHGALTARKAAKEAGEFARNGSEAEKPKPETTFINFVADKIGNVIDELPISEEEKQKFFKEFIRPKLKKTAPEIYSASEAIEAPVTPGMVLDGSQASRIESVLSKSPSFSGAKVQQAYDKGFIQSVDAVRSVLKTDANYSSAEAGKVLQDSIGDTFLDAAEYFSKFYEQFEKAGSHININESYKRDLIYNILHSGNSEFLEGKKIANDYIKEIEGTLIKTTDGKVLKNHKGEEVLQGGLNTLDQIKRFKTYIGKRLKGTASDLEKDFVSYIYDEMSHLEEKMFNERAREVLRDKTASAETKLFYSDLMKKRKQYNSEYRAMIKLAEPILKLFGKNRTFNGPMQFINFITNDVKPEQFAKSLFSHNNAKFLKFFSAHFQKETELLRLLHKSSFFDKFEKVAKIQRKAGLLELIDKIQDLPKEYKNIVFSKDDLKTLDNVKTYLGSWPLNANPSDTNLAHMYSGMIGKAGIYRNFKDAATSSVLNHLGEKAGAKEFGPVQELSLLEGIKNKVTKEISKRANSIFEGVGNGSKAIFEGSERMSPYVASKVATSNKKDEESAFEARIKDVSSLANNPELLLETISDKTQSIYSFAPDTSGSLAQALAAGNQFLNSKIPQQTPSSGLMFAMKPSFLDIKTFNNYVEILDAPLKALRHVKYGTLTNQTMETLTQVYPKLLAEMQQAVMSQMIDYSAKLAKGLVPPLPYQTLMSVSSFLGQPLDGSLSPDQILQTQATISSNAARQAQVEAQQKANLTAGTKRGPASRMMTPGQQGLYRRD